MNVRKCGLVLGLLVALASVPASATLLGDDVLGWMDIPTGPGNWFNPGGADGFTPAVVGAGPEFSTGDTFSGLFEADLGGSSLTLIFSRGPFGGGIGGDIFFIFEDLNWVDMPGGTISGVELVETNMVGLEWGWGSNDIGVFVPDQNWPTEVLFADFRIIADEPVPEPATLGLLGMGLVGLAARSRKKKTA